LHRASGYSGDTGIDTVYSKEVEAMRSTITYLFTDSL